MDSSVAFSLYALKKTRENAILTLSSFDENSWNTLAPGFNNTPAWNFCHGIVTTYLLTLGLADIETGLSIRELAKFRKGSNGNLPVSDDEMKRFIALADSSQEQIKTAYDSGELKKFQAYETSYGITLSNIEEAIHFVAVHEALHLGYLMAQRKVILS